MLIVFNRTNPRLTGQGSFIRYVMEDNRSREQEHLTVLPMEDDQDVGYLNKEEELLLLIDEECFEDVEENVTAKCLMNDGKNPLLFAIKVAERLHSRSDKNEIHSAEFTGLANKVEDFILRFLDPLLTFHSSREAFIEDPRTDVILETAVKLGQRKFFDHPIIVDLMRERWFGRLRSLASSRLWWLVLNIWCLFDIVLFPILFFLAFVLEWISKRKCAKSKCLSRLLHRAKETIQKYRENFVIPYFVFIRDMLSYLALLGLHFAICVQPSRLKFSSLEWAILVFLVGRLLIEIKQFTDMGWNHSKGWQIKLNALRRYARDRWNLFDLAILIIYFCAILPVRILTWVVSESVSDNRALEIAGYFYGFNTMLLTFRAFGSILETLEGVGTVQIAFFDIIRDAVVVVLHFVAITLAFSSSITKIYVAETSSLEGDGEKYTWWKITSHLGLSLLDLSDGLDFFKSADSVSETIVHVLYAAYLVMALILLINLLIALLSNTYQQVQDNSRKEWEFRKAVTVLTYCNYHPIPVPLNIISTLVLVIPALRKKMHKKDDATTESSELDFFADILVDQYRKTYGDSFPPTSTDKLEQVVDDSVNTRRMVNQVLCSTFKWHQASDKAFLPAGPKAWQYNDSIIVQGFLLTCAEENGRYGARYRTAFSSDFPHFEVILLGFRPSYRLEIAVAFEDCSRNAYLGEVGSVGYRTGGTAGGYICDEGEVKMTGSHKARQGDLFRCTIMFEEKQEKNGKLQVPVVFSINGVSIFPEGDPPLMEYCPDRPLYPCVVFNEKTTVLAKMCEREDVDHQGLQQRAAQDMVKSELAEVKSGLAELKTYLGTDVKSLVKVEKRATQDMIESDHAEEKSGLVELKSSLTEVRSEMRLELADVKEKLNSLLARLGEKM